MKIWTAQDLRKYDQFKLNNLKPPHQAGKITTSIFKKIKPIALTLGFLWGLHYLKTSYYKVNRQSWSVEYDINENVRFVHLMTEIKSIGYTIAFVRNRNKELLMEAIADLQRIQNRIHSSFVASPNERVSIERKVYAKFFVFEFGVTEKIREMNYKGDLLKIKKDIPITILGIPLFTNQTIKVIKRKRTLILSEEQLNIEKRIHDLVEKARAKSEITDQEASKFIDKSVQIEKSIKMGYQMYG